MEFDIEWCWRDTLKIHVYYRKIKNKNSFSLECNNCNQTVGKL